jgi:hypothetical protein
MGLRLFIKGRKSSWGSDWQWNGRLGLKQVCHATDGVILPKEETE